jgi:hypothetical protein
MPTDPAATTALEGLAGFATTGTDEALLPTNTFKIATTGIVVRKPIKKLVPGPRVITACSGHFGLF